jgi:cytochrome c oxidase subunit II
MPAPLPAGAHLQSALDPASASAGLIHELGLVLYIGTAVIFAAVTGLALYAACARPRQLSERLWLVGGGLIFPVVVLGALFVYALHVGHALSGAPSRPADIEVTGKLWWWEVRYPGDGRTAVLANEMYVPVGRPVEIALATDNVIHSFWIPALAGKVDMIPGRVNRLVIEADRPGIYRGQCAEYCGAQHAWMAFYVVAVPEDAYRQWLAGQASPAREPADAFLRLGREAFLREGCGACHSVRGTPAAGAQGPDLTHVGSRLSLAAGRLGNDPGALAGWIADSQHLKPGNLMPAGYNLSGEELRAVAAYLESLK